MNNRKGLKNIRTHSTLARDAKLVSVARDLHKINTESKFKDFDIKKHIYKKPKKSVPLLDDKRIKNYLIKITKDQLREIELAKSEGIPVSNREIEQLKKQLTQLKTE